MRDPLVDIFDACLGEYEEGGCEGHAEEEGLHLVIWCLRGVRSVLCVVK